MGFHDFIVNSIISAFLIATTTLIFYEILRFIWTHLPSMKLNPRSKMLIVMMAIFFGHTVSVWVYGIAYYLMVEYFNIGTFINTTPDDMDFLAYIYYSAIVYSSLGMGDILPEGGFRLVTGVEVLNGLVLIGWSASFTYLAMEKFWDSHRKK